MVDRAQVVVAAEAMMAGLVKLPGHAVGATKGSLRGDFTAAWRAYYVEEPAGAWEMLTQPATLRTLEGAMARLGGGGKAPPKQTSRM